jgi:hypothetical protein
MSNYSAWKNIINSFVPFARNEKAVYGNPGWLDEEGSINVIVIRENDENSYNDVIRNNDHLLIFENRPNETFREYLYQVTADPSTNKAGIAHLCQGAYESYTVRPHRWIAGRTALCQDKGEVKIFRTDTKRRIIDFFWGYFGINLHDTGGFWNSSLGCVILALKAQYQEFKQLLLRTKLFYGKKAISVFVINRSFLKSNNTNFQFKQAA